MRVPVGFFANWFKMRGRSFPWRQREVSPYGILLAEVLLKQTRAEMVASVWPALFRRYPNAASLECASPEVLLQHISRLGFGRQRTTALRQLSAAITNAGGLPTPARRSDGTPACRHVLRSCSRLLRIRSSRAGSGLEHCSCPLATGRKSNRQGTSGELLMCGRLRGLCCLTRRSRSTTTACWTSPRDTCKARSPLCGECPVASSCAHGRMLARTKGQHITAGDL